MRDRSDAPRLRADDYHPWTTYIDAREEAHRRGDVKVGTDHLVLALLRDPDPSRPRSEPTSSRRARR